MEIENITRRGTRGGSERPQASSAGKSRNLSHQHRTVKSVMTPSRHCAETGEFLQSAADLIHADCCTNDIKKDKITILKHGIFRHGLPGGGISPLLRGMCEKPLGRFGLVKYIHICVYKAKKRQKETSVHIYIYSAFEAE